MFTKLQRNKIKHGLHKGDVPIKYSYITEEGAWAWAELEQAKKTCSGGHNYDEELLRSTVDLYISELKIKQKVVIFDFWSGVGNTVIPTIQYLEERWYVVYYHAFDISEDIIRLLRENFEKHHIKTALNYTIIDFEEKDLSEAIFHAREGYEDSPILGLFLGNTIGNFSSIERVLSNIMDALDLQDRLVIGIERVDLENERWLNNMLTWYRTKASHRHDFATIGSFWFSQEWGKFDVRFNRSISSVETRFVFVQDVQMNIDEDHYEFYSWEWIRLFRSKKIDEEAFSRLLVGLNLRICNMRTSEDNYYLQVLVENKRMY